MPRSDWRVDYKGDCMPKSRDTAYAAKSVPEDVFEKNWKEMAGNPTPLKQMNKKHECTCNMREEITEEGHFLVEDECKFCNSPGKRVQIKMTDIEKKFSKRHMQKVQEFVFYGKKTTDIRDVMNRNA